MTQAGITSTVLADDGNWQDRQEEKIDKRKLKGQILSINYSKRRITLRDDRGFTKKIIVKQGMIGRFKVRDPIEVKMMRDNRDAKMIKRID